MVEQILKQIRHLTLLDYVFVVGFIVFAVSAITPILRLFAPAFPMPWAPGFNCATSAKFLTWEFREWDIIRADVPQDAEGAAMSLSRANRFLKVVPMLGAAAAFLAFWAPPAKPSKARPDENWRSYGSDSGNTRYSPLSQIDAANFSKLQVAWTFSTANLGPTPETNLESTPLVIDGVLYSTAGDRRDVVALDAATGEVLWTHREDEGKRAQVSPRRLSGRGLAYWADG